MISYTISTPSQIPPLPCNEHRLGARVCAEPPQDGLDVMPDGLGGEEQPPADFTSWGVSRVAPIDDPYRLEHPDVLSIL
jgi:hypothetical protein